MFVRLLHPILAKRLLNVVNLNPRQKAFIPTDGCAENTFLLDYIISDASSKHKQLSLVCIDLAKEFNMVSIHSIRCALKRHSINHYCLHRCNNYYILSTISISSVKLFRGVKQGDPLSPIIFNLIIDELLDSVPNNIGVHINNSAMVNNLSFADYLILISSSVVGMRELINITERFFTLFTQNVSFDLPKFNVCVIRQIKYPPKFNIFVIRQITSLL